VIELRRYAMRPGTRDVLIDIFEREFVEEHEACGMTAVGHFREPADPNSFVWFRGFATMESRRASLEAFYTSEPWMRNRDAANATLIDSDNVMLLRSARPGSGFQFIAAQGRFFAVSIRLLGDIAPEGEIERFERSVLPRLGPSHATAYFVSEERPNDYPRLPVRTERAIVAAGRCESQEALSGWRGAFDGDWETLVLVPATRSLLQ
jgi:hypothetical protein